MAVDLMNGVRVAVSQPSPRVRLAAPTGTVLAVPVRGPQGLPGSAAATYVHHQSAAASSWPIPHNLNGRPPVVILLDSDPTHPVFTDVTYVDGNNVVLTFPTPVTGTAYL